MNAWHRGEPALRSFPPNFTVTVESGRRIQDIFNQKFLRSEKANRIQWSASHDVGTTKK